MRIRTKLTLGVGALFLLITLLAAVSIWAVNWLNNDTERVLVANYNSLEYVKDMFGALEDTVDAGKAHQLFNAALQAQQRNITEPGEQELTDHVTLLFTRLREHPGETALRSTIRRELHGIMQVNMRAIAQKERIAEVTAERATFWISLTATLCFLIAFTLLVNFPGRIATPIQQLNEGIRNIAARRYDDRLHVQGNDEFAELARAFNTMAEKLEGYESSNLEKLLFEKTRAEAVINSLQDASIGLDEQGQVLFANQHALDLLGLHASEIVGRPAKEVARTNDLFRTLLILEKGGPLKIVLEGKENYFVPETIAIRKGGERLGSVLVLRNITAFEEKDRAKTQFLATISHELKTPLASTDLGLNLLGQEKMGALTAQQKEVLADLRKDNQRLIRLVSELLDLSQAESGNIQLSMGDVPVRDLVATAVNALKQQASERKLLFDIEVPANAGSIKADPDKSSWVLVNVLSNAVRFSPEGSTVRIRVTAGGKGAIAIEVSDQGPGIPPEHAAQIFDKFYTRTRGEAKKGTGLGLSIAKEFMLAMGGDISVGPAEGTGAAFTLRFASA